MTATILIVDDEVNARINIGQFLTTRGYEVLEAATLAEAREQLKLGSADIVLLDVELPDGYGPTLLGETAHLPMRPPIIIITAFGHIDMAVEAMKNGAHDFLQKPVQLAIVGEIHPARPGNCGYAQRTCAPARISAQGIFLHGVCQSRHAACASPGTTGSSSFRFCVNHGETGTGKEILANAIHQMGPRANKPFIAINCAAIQSTVLESELFGYEAGAFTSAEKRKLGLMEVADQGILFLDEISSMPVDMQAKLLRAIEEQKFRRVGGTVEVHVDVQIIAASNRDLIAAMEKGEFRHDLYYRLKVVDLHLPPLKDRKDDIPDLVGLFIRQNNQRLGVNIQDVTPRAMEALINHTWPGNIRELRNVIERAMLFCDECSIDLPHLPAEVIKATQ